MTRPSARTQGRWTIVIPPAELDPASSPALREQLEDLHEAGTRSLAVDWRGVSFFDSSAIGVLMGVHKRVRDADGELAVICPADNRRLFELMALDQVLTFVESDADLPE